MWDNSHEFTILVNFMVKCVYYIGLGSNGCFAVGGALTVGHYRTYIISGVGHLRSDSIVPLMLWMVVNNIRGNANSAEKG